ncbi:hypothetical protein LEMLEM_LOCUS27353 [Lemmus lemmus]
MTDVAKFSLLLWRCFSPHEELASSQAFEVTLRLPLVTKQDTEGLPRDTAQGPRMAEAWSFPALIFWEMLMVLCAIPSFLQAASWASVDAISGRDQLKSLPEAYQKPHG